jgi:hypothetical protein
MASTRSEIEAKFYSDRDPFKINPINALGREQKTARRQLYAEALEKPSQYIAMRAEKEKEIIDDFINDVNKAMWNLLVNGQYGENKTQITYISGADYVPGTPKPTVSKFCMKVSEAIEDILEEAVEMILPANHQSLAISRIASTNQDGAAMGSSVAGAGAGAN